MCSPLIALPCRPCRTMISWLHNWCFHHYSNSSQSNQTSSINIILILGKNANYQAPPKTFGSGIVEKSTNLYFYKTAKWFWNQVKVKNYWLEPTPSFGENDYCCLHYKAWYAYYFYIEHLEEIWKQINEVHKIKKVKW